ncbi:flagellar filament capping protein FliD [Leeia sp.]|uniref:flagellar filament capping protein FliD n=1 Tax=Leeia sp. TaxID=2884678 RepID=UPI0035B33A98
MAITSSGGVLDVGGLVEQLVTLERQPIAGLKSKQQKINSKISALGMVKADLSALQTALSNLKGTSSLSLSKATSSDTNVATASGNGSAPAGNYSLSVTKLAQSNKLITKAADGYASKTSTIANTAGTLSLSSSGNTFSVTLATDSTLEQIRDAINSSSSNTSIVASIINDGSNYRLSLAAKDTGASSGITVSKTSGGTALDKFTTTASGYDTVQVAQDAEFKVDGISFTRTKNTFDDVIEGVSLTLKSADATTPKTSTISVTKDLDGIKARVGAFVDAYNKLLATTSDLRKKGGTLEADNTVLTMHQQLLDVYNTPASISGNSYTNLSQIGISFQKDGKLSLDAAALEKAVNEKPAAVQELFSDSTQGFATRLYNKAKDMLTTGGLLSARSDGLSSIVKDTQKQIDRIEDRLVTLRQRYTAQFSALDAGLAQIQQVSNFLAKQLR